MFLETIVIIIERRKPNETKTRNKSTEHLKILFKGNLVNTFDFYYFYSSLFSCYREAWTEIHGAKLARNLKITIREKSLKLN